MAGITFHRIVKGGDLDVGMVIITRSGWPAVVEEIRFGADGAVHVLGRRVARAGGKRGGWQYKRSDDVETEVDAGFDEEMWRRLRDTLEAVDGVHVAREADGQGLNVTVGDEKRYVLRRVQPEGAAWTPVSTDAQSSADPGG